jgi:S-adenosyl-L-methionine hydrolase (adenosine-forming)
MAIVTLTTDIGQQDYIVGAIKGQLLSLDKSMQVADINHYLSQANYPQAAYICKNAFRYFPPNTFHIVILNFFENANKHFLIAKHNDQWILCADNGILTMIAGEKPSEIVAIKIPNSGLLSTTQLMASSIRNIIENNYQLNNIGFTIHQIAEKYPLRATAGNNWMEGQILFIDNFENVVINITKEEFEEHRQGRAFSIVFKRDETIERISNNYASTNEGEKLAWFNSAGYLEIAINKGNIAGLFGLQGYNEKMHQQGSATQNKWFYQTVRIFFS